MKRKAHVLLPLPSKPPYGSVLLLQAAAERQYQSESDEIGTIVPVRIVARFADRAGSTPLALSDGSDCDTELLWQWIAQQVRTQRRVMMISAGARELAAMLGLWRLVMQGGVTLSGREPWWRNEPGTSAGERWRGYAVLEGPPTVVTFKVAGSPCEITWVDPANYGWSPPADVCADADAGRAGGSASAEPWWLRPEDVETQLQVVSDWLYGYVSMIHSLGMGNMENTAASQAAVGFRSTAPAREIVIHDSPAVCRLERAALYGGRAECRYVGRALAADVPAADIGDEGSAVAVLRDAGSITQLDVNSLYPAVAASARLPVRLETTVDNPSVKTLLAACERCCVIADVTVCMREPAVPYNHTDLTIYPVGSFRSALCGPEILLAAQHGHVVACHRLALYASGNLYYGWVDRLYKYRLAAQAAGDAAGASAIKAILNSSFGKWAQRPKRWVDRPQEVCHEPFSQWWGRSFATGELTQWRSFAWAVQECVIDCPLCGGSGEHAGRLCPACEGFSQETPDSFPAITAYVNSLGRVRLWRLLRTARLEHVYYYDTDSIWCDPAGYGHLERAGEIDEHALGKLKVVGAYSDVTWHNVKRYVADGRLVLAGADAHSYRTGDAFAQSYRTPPVGHYLRHHEPPGIDRHVGRVRLNSEYRLGQVQPNGWVRPLHVD